MKRRCVQNHTLGALSQSFRNPAIAAKPKRQSIRNNEVQKSRDIVRHGNECVGAITIGESDQDNSGPRQ